MSLQNNRRDQNRVPTISGVTDDANLDPRILKVDPVTDRLKVNTTVTGTLSTDSRFQTNTIDEASATVIYIGKEDADGAWMILKVDTSLGTVFTYATVLNNASYTTYATAWAARASLTYSAYSVAF